LARANYIWVVSLEDDDFEHIISCFTVKHELITWLERRIKMFPHEEDMLMISKHHDNPQSLEELEDVPDWTAAEFLRN
jgi:hypothetical protein